MLLCNHVNSCRSGEGVGVDNDSDEAGPSRSQRAQQEDSSPGGGDDPPTVLQGFDPEAAEPLAAGNGPEAERVREQEAVQQSTDDDDDTDTGTVTNPVPWRYTRSMTGQITLHSEATCADEMAQGNEGVRMMDAMTGEEVIELMTARWAGCSERTGNRWVSSQVHYLRKKTTRYVALLPTLLKLSVVSFAGMCAIIGFQLCSCAVVQSR